MNSSDAQLEQLTAYIDGELNEHERREVEALLARDPDAATLLESLRRVADSVSALPRELAPLNLSAAVQERMARQSLLGARRESREDLPRLVIWTNRLAIAACLGLVCTAGWLGMQSSTVHGPASLTKETGRTRSPAMDSIADNSANEKLGLNAPPSPPLSPAGGVSEIAGASPDMRLAVAFSKPGEVERRLIQEGVSNDELQTADLSGFSNRVVIETDDSETRDAIVKLVHDFAQDKKIPNANTQRLPEPVQVQQKFFFVSQTQQEPPIAPGNEETWIGVNAPAKDTDELMARVQEVGSQKKAPLQVEVNGCSMETPQQASQLLAMNSKRNLEALDPTGNYRQSQAAPAPALAARSASAEGGPLRDEDDDSAKLEDSPPPTKASKASPSKSSGYGAAKKENTKSGIESKDDDGEARPEAEPVADNADETKRTKEVKGGVGGGSKSQPRGGFAKNEPVGEDAKIGSSATVKGDKIAPPAVAIHAVPADVCVTLSICVRNPSAQRARLGPAPATQASDTLRPPAATSRPQTSMPAAGADRE